MAKKRKAIPEYGTVMNGGKEYYRTRIEDADGKRVAIYGKTREELYDKVEEAKRQIEDCTFRRSTPTVKEYCEKWLLMQSAHIRATTLVDYTSKAKNYIIKPLGHKYMAEVTADDVKLNITSREEIHVGLSLRKHAVQEHLQVCRGKPYYKRESDQELAGKGRHSAEGTRRADG